jgi:Protein of unknown function (DUF3085)
MPGTLEFDAKEVLDMVGAVPASAPVMLVGDQGVYLCTDVEGGKPLVVYARGCNPLKDAEFYENKRRIFGGDDGADPIATAGDMMELAKNCKRVVKMKLTKDAITLLAPVGGR